MTGHVRRRGERSWEIKFDIGMDASGKRLTRYHSFKGTKREADAELIRLKAGAGRGDYIDPSKLTVALYLDRWDRDWATSNLGPKSLERYREILAAYIRPELGATNLQKLRPAHIAALYAKLLREGRVRKRAGSLGLSPASVRYTHRVLHRALGHAVLWDLLVANPCASVEPPKPATIELEILSELQMRDVLKKLRGRPIYPIAAVGLATGMRRGELLALRWQDVSLDRARIQVEQSIEQTKAGLRFKSPKTKNGRRSISLAASVVSELRALWLEHQKRRLALGQPKGQEGQLVFGMADGQPRKPNSLSTEWRKLVIALKLPKVTLHAWRHTHASQLIASGMDVLTISRRLGHGSPSITLNVYGHLFHSSDDRAAAIFEAAVGDVLTEREPASTK